MTRTRRKAIDPLHQPIIRPNPLVVTLIAHGKRPAEQAAIWDAADNFVLRQKLQKLLLLAKRHGVNIDAPHSWLELSLRLAEEHVRGFKVLDVPPRRPGGPRKDYFELVKAIDARTDPSGGHKRILQACHKLSREKGPWKGRDPKTLQTRYHEWFRTKRALLSEPSELIK